MNEWSESNQESLEQLEAWSKPYLQAPVTTEFVEHLKQQVAVECAHTYLDLAAPPPSDDLRRRCRLAVRRELAESRRPRGMLRLAPWLAAAAVIAIGFSLAEFLPQTAPRSAWDELALTALEPAVSLDLTAIESDLAQMESLADAREFGNAVTAYSLEFGEEE